MYSLISKSILLNNLALNSKNLLASELASSNGVFFKRNFHLSKVINLVSKEFEDAKANVAKLQEDHGNDVKLRMYALFKQATVGPCNTPKPGFSDFVGRAKWNAWSELKMTQAEAEQEYIKTINDLLKKEGIAEATPTNSASSKVDSILSSIEYGNVLKLTLNRPNKYNALNIEMYNQIMQSLNDADKDPNILAVVITGAGDYYCSGNDLSMFSSKEAMTNMKKAAADGGVILENFVNSFVNFSKPLIAVVNGPAVGISVTVLGLFDMILASDKATFVAPFTKIAQSPEGCSSYTFPKLMGHIKAAEFLLFNRKLTAQEAFDRNLVTEVIPHADFDRIAWERIAAISKLPKESLLASKRILVENDRELLRKLNKKECDVLVGRWTSQEFVRVIMEFWKKK